VKYLVAGFGRMMRFGKGDYMTTHTSGSAFLAPGYVSTEVLISRIFRE